MLVKGEFLALQSELSKLMTVLHFFGCGHCGLLIIKHYVGVPREMVAVAVACIRDINK
jgi:hypothetical protein